MNISPDYFASPADPDTLARLKHGLGLAAEAEGLLDVAYTTIDSPGHAPAGGDAEGPGARGLDIEDHDRVL